MLLQSQKLPGLKQFAFKNLSKEEPGGRQKLGLKLVTSKISEKLDDKFKSNEEMFQELGEDQRPTNQENPKQKTKFANENTMAKSNLRLKGHAFNLGMAAAAI